MTFVSTIRLTLNVGEYSHNITAFIQTNKGL